MTSKTIGVGDPIPRDLPTWRRIMENAWASDPKTSGPSRGTIDSRPISVFALADSGSYDRFDVVCVAAEPVATPSADLDKFKAYAPKFTASEFTAETMKQIGGGVLVGICLDKLTTTSRGRVLIAGTAKALVELGGSPSQLRSAMPKIGERFAKSAAQGPINILWKPPGTTGQQWCEVGLTQFTSLTNGFDVNLEQVGGANGNATTAASYTYDVYQLLPTTPPAEGKLNDAPINPSIAPHRYIRTPGFVLPAKIGRAFYAGDNSLVIIDIHEPVDAESC